jgi:hypothetical protein
MTVRFHLTQPGWLSLRKETTNVGNDAGEKGTLRHCWWESKLVQPLWKALWRFLKKLKIELPYDSAIPLLGIYLKECKSAYNRGTFTPTFIAALFTTAKLWNQPRCPTTDEWIKKMWYIFTVEYYLAIKKNEIRSFAEIWMELEIIMLCEISHAHKDKYHVFSHMLNLD